MSWRAAGTGRIARLPMLNCCQSMTALWEFCFTTVVLPVEFLIVALPATTCPPLGLASASTGVKAPNPRPIWPLRFSNARRAESTVRCVR